ncbi:MAG: UDP-N-acetylmuramoyl-tripeptide--D-alanyl-D-alanine ligase [Desulfococcaceae bacterium]
MKKTAWRVSDLLSATGGEWLGGNPEHRFSAISIDSRTLPADALFFAVRGERLDGHDYIDQAIARGASGIVVDQEKTGVLSIRKWTEQGIACVAVTDTTDALGDLARFHRRRIGCRIAAITGSNGKTTTRAMTASVLERGFVTLATRGNLNNQFGLPLTLFRLTPEHRTAVLELGMNHAGEIRKLTRICEPDLGVITNIAPAHLHGVGSLEGVMNAKGELLEEMPDRGTAVLNGDDPRCRELARRWPGRLVLFGTASECTLRAESIEESETGISFVLKFPGEERVVRLCVPGRFMVSNALAAAAVGYESGLKPSEIRDGLEGFVPVPGRMNLLNTRRSIYLIDDTYNANPASMKGAIRSFEFLKGSRRGFLVLGDMLELGEDAPALHREVGTAAAQAAATMLMASGSFAESIREGALEGGMASDQVFLGSREEITAALKAVLQPEDWVLVKGSRGMAMEKILNAIKDWADQTEDA